MERLLETAKKVCDKAEVFSADSEVYSVSFENAQLKDIQSRIQSGVSLRIIKNNRLGFAYTKNIGSREGLIENALDSLRGGVECAFDFPLTNNQPSLQTYDHSIENLSNSDMVDECTRVCDFLSEKTKAQLNVSAHRAVSGIRIMNTSGTDLTLKTSTYLFHAGILYPYTSASLHRTLIAKAFHKAPDEYLLFLSNMYSQSLKEASPGRKRLKVLFMPETMYVLIWRLASALNGQSIYQNISPLAQRMGEKIFDEKLSLYNDPLNDAFPHARAFDDEGTPCSHFQIIENGALRNFYYDLYFAHKLKTSPTGHGFRSGDLVSSKPQPSLSHLCMTTGDLSFSEIIKSIDYGIIIAEALGAHSGNIPHGDFSIGVSPALYIEHGEIVGHVKDVMVAGNIYETLKHVIAIEDSLHPCPGGKFPALLVDNVSVTIKT